MRHKIQIFTFLFITMVLLISSCTKVKKNPEITANEIYNHINYLASDMLKGRYPGTPTGDMAASYIHKQFTDYGLTPACNQGYQPFDIVTGVSLGENNHLFILNDSVKLDSGYRPVGFSGNAKVNATVTFVGYGFEIENNDLHWNDYAAVNVSGKWVMLLREDPEPQNMESAFIPYASDRAKVTLAKDKGAAGVLLVNGVNTSKKDRPMELTYDQNLSDAGIPVLSITRAVANKILDETGNIETLEQTIINEKKSLIIATQTIVDANVALKQDRARAKNVVFTLVPHPESNEYIAVGAHYDHLGMGGPGVNSRMPDTIAVHNGADDNASGVAGIMELAGKLNSIKDTLNKNFVFIAFDAEEMGLLGSKFFTEHFDTNNMHITAMLNFDMIGRLKHDTIGISIGGTGTASEFDSLLNTVDTRFRKNFSPDGYGPSDHASFYSENIPVLFFSTGAHADYHTPLDDVDKIDTESEAEILNYAEQIAIKLSRMDALSFKSTGTAYKQSRRNRLKVTFGIIPDFSGIQKEGLGIDGVRKGGPAEKGGLLKGDKITAINGETVTNIYDYMFRLSKLKAGSTAIVEIERNNKKEVLLIQL